MTFVWPAETPTSAKASAIAAMHLVSLLLLSGQKIYVKGEMGSGPHATLRWHRTASMTPREDCRKGVNRSQGSVVDT